MSSFQFNAQNVPVMQEHEPIPAGWYSFMFKEVAIVPTKDGAGLRLTAQASVLDEGPYKGRVVFVGLNIRNANAQAQQIAETELSTICHAIGMLVLQSEQQLVNQVFKGKVKIAPARDGYAARNEFVNYKHINDTSVGNMQAVAAVPGMVPQQAPAFQPAPAAYQQPAPAYQQMPAQPWEQQPAPAGYQQQMPPQQMPPVQMPPQAQPQQMPPQAQPQQQLQQPPQQAVGQAAPGGMPAWMQG